VFYTHNYLKFPRIFWPKRLGLGAFGWEPLAGSLGLGCYSIGWEPCAGLLFYGLGALDWSESLGLV
jgi:hypothetical protein